MKSSTFLIRPIVRSATSDGPVDEVAAGDLDVLARDGGPHLIDGQAVGVQPVGVQQQLDLAPAIALQADRADVLQRLEHLLDLLVGDLRELLLRPRAVDVERAGSATRRDPASGSAGARASRGNCSTIVATLSRTSCVADSMSRSSVKVMVTCDWPWLEVARSSSMPLIVLTASSMRLVICVSTSSALAPGSWTWTVTTGRVGLRHQVEAEILVRERAQHDERRRHHDGEHRPLDADVCELHWPAPSAARPRPPLRASPRRAAAAALVLAVGAGARRWCRSPAD